METNRINNHNQARNQNFSEQEKFHGIKALR